MEVSVRVLASLLNGEIEGNPEVIINRPSRIEEGGEGSVSFLGNPKYEHYAYSTTASALLVDRGFKPREPVQATLIRVDDVYAAVGFLLEKFDQAKAVKADISDKAQIDPTAHIGKNVFIGPFAIVEAGAQIGDGCQIGAQVYIGRNAVVGNDTRLYSSLNCSKSNTWNSENPKDAPSTTRKKNPCSIPWPSPDGCPTDTLSCWWTKS